MSLVNRSTETEINLAFSNNLGAFGGRKDAIFKVHLVRSCDADAGAYPAQSEGWSVIRDPTRDGCIKEFIKRK